MASTLDTGEPTARETRRQGLIAAGSVFAALAASSCCLLPLALFSIGASGAWIGRMTALAPYQPIFLTLALGLLGCGYWLVYRPPKAACEGGACARPLPNRLVLAGLWSSTALVLAALAFPFVAPLILG